MNLVENESFSEKHDKDFEMLEYHQILEDIGNITFRDSENMQCTSEGYKDEGKDIGHGGKLVTGDYLKNVNDFSTEALGSLKNIPSYISTIAHNTSRSILKTAQNLKSVIVKNDLFDYLTNSKKNYNMMNSEEEIRAPWVETVNEVEAKKLILSLSENRKTFLRKPPEGVFEFKLDEYLPIAKLLLKEDPRLQKMRFELVPKHIKEDCFWKNYFYRISLIKQSFNISLSKVKFEGAKSEGCLSHENPGNLEKNAEIQNSSENANIEQRSLEIEKGLKEDEGKPQKDGSFENILETEIQEFNSSLYSVD
ncbi:Synapse-associated protein 1, partial [Araneus ventricosus]